MIGWMVSVVVGGGECGGRVVVSDRVDGEYGE